MRQPLYIGVTGFMTPQDVRAALRCFDGQQGRKLMVGVLASSKTLAGETNKYPNRYPKRECISEIFQKDEKALNLVHYSTDEEETLSNQLRYLVAYSGPYLHGFQLNVAWPSTDEIKRFHEATNRKYRIVLQVGAKAMDVYGINWKIASAVADYRGLIDDVLIDSSGGKGQSFDPDIARGILKEFKGFDLDINLGVAGGLGPDRMKLLEPLLDEFSDINIDAEGRLRGNKDDDLDVITMASYLAEAQLWFHSYTL